MNVIEDHIRLLDHLKIKKAHVWILNGRCNSYWDCRLSS
jgi:hypothetical protein